MLIEIQDFRGRCSIQKRSHALAILCFALFSAADHRIQVRERRRKERSNAKERLEKHSTNSIVCAGKREGQVCYDKCVMISRENIKSYDDGEGEAITHQTGKRRNKQKNLGKNYPFACRWLTNQSIDHSLNQCWWPAIKRKIKRTYTHTKDTRSEKRTQGQTESKVITQARRTYS